MHLVTQSALLKALGWSLFNSLWQMALLWLAYILLTSLFRKVSSHARHSLAVGLLGTGTLAFLFTFLSAYYAAANGESLSSGWPAALSSTRRLINLFLPYCSFLYLLALSFLFIRYSNHYLHSRRLRTQQLTKIQPRLRLFVRETAQYLGITKEVSVWMSSLVEGPVTLGWLRPVILIPVAMVNNLSVQQVEAILLHELAHIKRFDYLLNLGVTVVDILFFFNPFSRLLIRYIRREREHRCDDLVMQFRYDPHLYVSALLSLATPAHNRHSLALAAAGKSDRLLLHRVRRILKQKRAGDRPGMKPVVFFLFTMLTGMIGLSGTGNPVARLMQRNKTRAESLAAAFPRSPLETQSPTVWYYIKEGSQTADRASEPKKKKVNDNTRADDDDQAPAEDLFYTANDEGSDSSVETITTTTAVANASAEAPEYSIQQPTDGMTVTSSPSPVTGAVMPYVPSSSFSYRVTEDTSAIFQQLGVLIESEGKATELKEAVQKAISANDAEILKTQALIDNQEQALATLRSSSQCGQTSVNIRKQLMTRQLRSQRVLLQKQMDLQLRLRKAIVKLRIVYI